VNIDGYARLVGETPLVHLGGRIYAKLETYSPTGSVKDRTVSYIVARAIESGALKEGSILCEATSGNTGIALSSIAAQLGLRCVIFMPSNMSEERKKMMSAYGATFVDAPPDDFARAIEMRDEFLRETPGAWSPLQFSNPLNIECHLALTAPEIDRQLSAAGLAWSDFVHGSGTGGTIEGVRRWAQPRGVRVHMTVPGESPHGIQGIGDGRHFLASPDLMDRELRVPTQDAIARAVRFARETGILVGVSSGANIIAAERVAASGGTGAIVTMLCDRGERYLSIYR
jgi:cysteine synthase A